MNVYEINLKTMLHLHGVKTAVIQDLTQETEVPTKSHFRTSMRILL